MTVNTFKPLQAQSFSLAGGGVIAGATSLILKSFKQIDGTTNITMSNLGSTAFITLEPGNGTLEEQIAFTGVTQNSNGTATLTGVYNVSMIDPYTVTSGLAQTHAGSTSAILSNTSGYYDQFPKKGVDSTISGKYTFPNDDVSNAGIATDTDTAVATAFVTLGQLSRQAISGASNASTTVKGIVQLPTQAQVDAKTTTGSTSALLALTPDKQRSTLLSDYKPDTGAADAYIIAPSPTVTALTVGQRFSFKVLNTNTGTSTLVVNALTGTAIFKNNGSTVLAAGDFVAGQVVEVEYNGINGFMLMTPVGGGTGLPTTSSAAINRFLTTTNGTSLTFGVPFDLQTFTSSGTWTKATNLTGDEMIFVQCWGGGGGGAGVTNATTEAGGGGGGGGYTEERYRASDLGSTVTVTIGAGGAGGTAGNAGTTGSATTFGSLVSAAGGIGGIVGSDGVAGAGSAGGAGSLGFGTSVYEGGAGGAANTVGTRSTFGGGGGGGGRISGSGGAGAAAYFGGAGGGGGSASGGSGGAGGAAKTGYGGAGGSGATGGAVGNASVALAGGGGGAATNAGAGFAGGAGFRGEARIWVFY